LRVGKGRYALSWRGGEEGVSVGQTGQVVVDGLRTAVLKPLRAREAVGMMFLKYMIDTKKAPNVTIL
jgi:hypothetical protein